MPVFICLYSMAPPCCCYPVHRFLLVSELFNKGSLFLISGFFSSPQCLFCLQTVVPQQLLDNLGALLGHNSFASRHTAPGEHCLEETDGWPTGILIQRMSGSDPNSKGDAAKMFYLQSLGLF